jgi:predicted small lipoprotein YifL
MKRATVSLIVLSTLLAMLLTGCGANGAGSAGAAPTNMPIESMMPDPSDGVVNDTDGIIGSNGDGTTRAGGAGNQSGTNGANGAAGRNGTSGTGGMTDRKSGQTAIG